MSEINGELNIHLKNKEFYFMTKNVLDKIFAVYDDLYEAEKKIGTSH